MSALAKLDKQTFEGVSKLAIAKRDGREQSFEASKITEAIYKCFLATKESNYIVAVELTLEVVKKIAEIYGENTFSVENVQDLVETVLIEKGFVKSAKSYILYRDKRSRLRDAKSKMMDAVCETLQETNRDNANVGNSPSAKVLQISEIASAKYYLDRVIPDNQSAAHLDGDIYIHDLAWYGKTLTCIQIPLDRLLRDGFNNGHGYIRPPKSIKTAAALAAIILQGNQNDMHGGQSFAYFDRDMAEYVRAEKAKQYEILKGSLKELGLKASKAKIDKLVNDRTREETSQAMEGFIYNLNTMHSRAGAQVPFSSINIGTDTTAEGKMVIECLLKAYEKGLGKGETPIFPNIVFKLKEGVNMKRGEPNYDMFKLSMKVACKRLMPTFAFLDSSFNKPFSAEEVAYMGCRTRVISNCNGEAQTNSRGNLSFTSINLPRLGLRANKNLDEFWALLDKTFELCVEQLLTRYDLQKNLKVKDFPFLMQQKLYMDSESLKPNDKIEQAIKHGTLTVGFIGLAECLMALVGKHHGQCDKAQELGLEIVAHIRKRCDEAMEKYGLNFSLLATPAEQLSGKFVRSDIQKFGNIYGVTDKEWYTNSFHVPVQFDISALEKIKLEAPYHKYCNAGHISYVELPSAPEHNLQAYEALLNAMSKADMGYVGINFPVDVCASCGFNGVISEAVCPKCECREIHRVRRITGYLSTLDRFNDSKLAEVKHRQIHNM
ncbi:MAG: anaerobic ribonucleoside-triphosphate reductase [Firmicutes bacterium]|nr:anaerobic ribonucleoside-triphosphate reductase [Bacillota bacterium]